MSDEIVIVHSLFVGSVTPGIHIVLVPCHVPTSLASRSCILPGVPATMQAFMSSSVQPGGSFISGALEPAAVCADDCASFAGSAIATTAANPNDTTSAGV